MLEYWIPGNLGITYIPKYHLLQYFSLLFFTVIDASFLYNYIIQHFVICSYQLIKEWSCLNIYLKGRKRNRCTERPSFIGLFPTEPQQSDPGQRKGRKPRSPASSSTWEAEVKVKRPSSTVLPGILAGSRMESGTAGTQTCTPICYASGGLTKSTATPALILHFKHACPQPEWKPTKLSFIPQVW